MAIHPKISPRIIPSISTVYTDVNRIFMEYIDNAIDSADQNWLDEVRGGYTRPIEIVVNIKGKNHKDAEVTVTDNCFGITNFIKVVDSIGDSDKKSQRLTNGQFGFGIYSFMAACTDLCLTSKMKDKSALKIDLNKEQFNVSTVEEVSIPNPQEVKKFPYESGTQICLSGFEKDAWKTVSGKNLREDVEKHFEPILRRENLTVRIVDEQSGEDVLCKAFDYLQIEGEIYEDYIEHLDIESGRRYKKNEQLHLKNPVHIYLKMTKGVVLNKPPVFVSKGRRICEIKDVKSFKSANKSTIWGHANVTGYVDVKDILGPTIARTDFKTDKNSRALFDQLIQLESLILDCVKRANEHTDEKHYQQLEDALNKALSRLAKIDAMNFRTAFLKGGDINLEGGSVGFGSVEGAGAGNFNGKNSGEGDGGGEDDGEGLSTKEGGSDAPGSNVDGDNAKDQEVFEDSDFKGEERKKSGFNIHISDAEPQVDAESGKQLRSLLSGDQIIVFKKHNDFQVRLSHNRQGGSKISDRLLAYIAGEITIHYKDQFYNKRQNGQPEYSKDMFVGMAEFIYQLEDALSALSGRNLSELSSETL